MAKGYLRVGFQQACEIARFYHKDCAVFFAGRILGSVLASRIGEHAIPVGNGRREDADDYQHRVAATGRRLSKAEHIIERPNLRNSVMETDRRLPSHCSWGIWALYDVLGLGQASGLVAAIAVLVIVGVLATTVPYWNRVLAYARREDASEDATSEEHGRNPCARIWLSRMPAGSPRVDTPLPYDAQIAGSLSVP